MEYFRFNFVAKNNMKLILKFCGSSLFTAASNNGYWKFIFGEMMFFVKKDFF